VDLQTASKKGLVVEIRGSTAPSTGWHDGKYEGQRGIVQTVSANALSSAGSTTVTLTNGEKINPPPQVLVPVPPENNQENAMVLTGHLKGQVVRTINQDDAETWVVLREGGMYDHLPETHMCQFVTE
jgi:hypothetical protein